MAPEYGMTVSPSVTINADGSETLDYNQGVVESDEQKLQQIGEFTRNQDQQFFEDPNRGVVNRHSDIDFEALEDEIEEEEQEEILYLPDQDYADLKASIGGEEQYHSIISWAASVLPPESIDFYDRIMDSGDYEAIQESVNALYQHYLENDGESFQVSEREHSNVSAAFVDQLVDQIGESTYANAVQWAANGGLTQQDISAYDRVMERGNQQQLMDSAFNLVRYFQQQTN